MENSKKYKLSGNTASHWKKFKQEFYIMENWGPEMTDKKKKKYHFILILQVRGTDFEQSIFKKTSEKHQFSYQVKIELSVTEICRMLHS